METNKPTEFHSIKEVAAYAHVGPPAIYLAISNGRLKATKKNNRLIVTLEDLEEYQLTKYNRDRKKINGQLVFDVKNGQFSVFHVSKILSEMFRRPYHVQRIYYFIYAGKIRASKKGSAWVISREALEEFVLAEGAHPSCAASS